MDQRYRETDWWLVHHDLPFSTLVRFVEKYCHPEVDEEAYPELIRRARGSESDLRMRVFKDELRRVLTGERVPGQALSRAAAYDDGSERAFLERLWGDLYPGEPVPTAGG